MQKTLALVLLVSIITGCSSMKISRPPVKSALEYPPEITNSTDKVYASQYPELTAITQ